MFAGVGNLPKLHLHQSIFNGAAPMSSRAQVVDSERQTMPPQAYLFLLAGLAAISCASIFIRFAQDEQIPSLVIAAGRLSIAALLLTPFTLRKHLADLRALKPADLGLGVASGVLLAVHFATWIASLEYTSVLISVVMVTTSPLWVAILEVVFLRARLRPVVIGGLIAALGGGILIGVGGGTGMETGSNPVLGSLLALTGALAIAIYLVVGRKLRAMLPLMPYIWLVYGCAAITLLLALLLSGTPVTGYSSQGYLWVLALALVPQLIGHTSLNYTLRYMSATFVSVATQMEPIGSALAAFIIFREQPGPLGLLGSVVILAGVLMVSYGQQKKSDE
jgi:drug/metabolite transporter (DMT)-like permease